MPVKVRCPGCQKVLNAPEKARGKAIRCPDCETVIRVPAQQKEVAKQAAVPPPPSSSSIIANLDLQRYEETEHRICPRCGADVSPDDIECPKCEVMLETGQLSDRKKKARARKGPDPKLYYKSLISDAWQFVMEHKKIAFRTATYAVLFSVVSLACTLMMLWVGKVPLKVFWGFCSLVVLMIPPGWAWFLHTTVIMAALEKRKKLPKRVLFDFFQSSALGIKFIVWTLAMGLPFHAAAGVFWVLDMPIWAVSFAGFGVLFALLVFPIAMVHMAMPVTTPAWKFWVMDGLFFRNMLPSLYWLFFLFLTMIPALAVVAVGAVFYAKDVKELVETLNHNTEITNATEIALEAQASNRGTKISDEIKKLSEEKPTTPNWMVLIVPSICWIVASGLFGFGAVFNMRSNGLFAIYFRERLDLISMVDEIKYVPKPVVDRDEDQADQMTWGKVAFGIGIAMALGIAIGMIYGMASGNGLVFGFVAGAYWSSLVVGSIGGFMLLGTAFQESVLWGLGCWFVPGVSIVFVVMHWQKAKWGFVINLAGLLMAVAIFVIAIVAGMAFEILGPQGDAALDTAGKMISALC